MMIIHGDNPISNSGRVYSREKTGQCQWSAVDRHVEPPAAVTHRNIDPQFNPLSLECLPAGRKTDVAQTLPNITAFLKRSVRNIFQNVYIRF